MDVPLSQIQFQRATEEERNDMTLRTFLSIAYGWTRHGYSWYEFNTMLDEHERLRSYRRRNPSSPAERKQRWEGDNRGLHSQIARQKRFEPYSPPKILMLGNEVGDEDDNNHTLQVQYEDPLFS